MYTRCPECHTAFRITVAQLKARDGLVRCGRCDSVFRADLHLFAPPGAANERTESVAEEEAYVELDAGEPESGEHSEIRDTPIPVISDLSLFRPKRHWLPTTLWFLSGVILLILLLGQFAYFYRHELAQLPNVRPAIVYACRWLDCEVAAIVDKTVPEITQTSIAPHPRYVNALRIRASLVNRTEQSLPLPLLQVSLTDNDGKLLARRTFVPREYLDPAFAAGPLSPNVAVQALVDITNPDNKAAGYEVQLFRPHTNAN